MPDEDYYKHSYDELYAQNKKLWQFIECLESYTSDWDDFCDCGCREEPDKNTHDADCTTMKMRKDVENLTKKE